VVRSGTGSATMQMEESSRRVVYQYKEIERKRGTEDGGRNERIYRLMRNIPTNMVMIPAHCQRETCSFKKKAASPTVTAP